MLGPTPAPHLALHPPCLASAYPLHHEEAPHAHATEEAFLKTLQRHGIIGRASLPIGDLCPKAGTASLVTTLRTA